MVHVSSHPETEMGIFFLSPPPSLLSIFFIFHMAEASFIFFAAKTQEYPA